MALNYFIGWTQARLEAELTKAQQELAAGASIQSGSGGDTSFSQISQIPIQQRIEMLYRALNALDSTTYPAASITRHDRTVYAAPNSTTSSDS